MFLTAFQSFLTSRLCAWCEPADCFFYQCLVSVQFFQFLLSPNHLKLNREKLLDMFFTQSMEFSMGYISGAPRAKRACGAPWVNKSTHPRKFGNHVTDRPSAPQAYQCLLSHFLATLGAQEKADCTSMLSSIDSCQNRVSADQYHLTVSRAQVSTHQGRVFF